MKKNPKKGEGIEYFEELAQPTKPSKNSYLKWKVNTNELETNIRHLKDDKKLNMGK